MKKEIKMVLVNVKKKKKMAESFVVAFMCSNSLTGTFPAAKSRSKWRFDSNSSALVVEPLMFQIASSLEP